MIIQVHRAAEKIYKSMICFVCFRLFICIETQCSDIITYYLDSSDFTYMEYLVGFYKIGEKSFPHIVVFLVLPHISPTNLHATNYQSTF